MSLYLLLDLAAVAGPLVLSFDRRVRFLRSWPAALASSLLVALPFIAWDWYMTSRGAWSFEPGRVGSPRILGLPLEELLFFVVVPFSCIFIYEVLGAYFPDREGRARRLPWIGAAAACAALAGAAWPRLYTSTILGAVSVFLAAAGTAAPRVLARKRFWLALLISYLPFLVMNGILTAAPVVRYAPDAIIGLRIYTIPVEDFVYSFAMLGAALVVFSVLRTAAPPRGTRTEAGSDRKEKHLVICTDESRFNVEGSGAGFDRVRFLHDALPEIAVAEVDTAVSFLGARVAMPYFISCMTGGSEGGFRANRTLAAAAQELGVPVGLGSIRVLLSNPELFPHFHVKPLAPDVPVLANIGGVQVRDGDRGALFRAVEALEAQALVVHLNPGQELFQADGDRDFRGVKDAVKALIDAAKVPVIVKETGFGIVPGLARELLDAGAAYVDLAGAGGTNWISVESYRLPEADATAAEDFRGWGLPTALLLAAFEGRQGRLLASGGIRTGMDAAKAIAMGAEMAGLALPAIRAAVGGGKDAVVALYRRLQQTLRAVMIMTGSRTLDELRQGTTWLEPAFAAEAASLARAGEAPRRRAAHGRTEAAGALHA